VYNADESVASKSAYSKKTQATLKIVLKSMFPENGNLLPPTAAD
jgi:hypothetical protein